MGTRTGRPRGFDRDAALEQAMLLFWDRGYDTVSIRDLTDAMGIGAPSLYAAFTDKQALFEEAVEAYANRYGGYIAEAMAEPTAYLAVRRLLTRSAAQQTQAGRPAGCLILNGTTNHTAASERVAAGLRARRRETATLLETKIGDDVARGDLPADTDPHRLATYVMAIWQGLSQLARDGRTRHELDDVVAMAMTTWPGAGG